MFARGLFFLVLCFVSSVVRGQVAPPPATASVQLSVVLVSAVRFNNEPEVYYHISYMYRTDITVAVSTLPWSLEDKPVTVLPEYSPGTEEIENAHWFEPLTLLPGELRQPDTQGFWEGAGYTGIMASAEEWNQWTLTLGLPGAIPTTAWGCVRVRSFENLIDAPAWMPQYFWDKH